MRRGVVALLALLAVLSVVAPLTTAAQSEDEAASGNYTLDDLKDGGPTISNAPGSVRLGEQRQWWVVHWPAAAVGANPGEDDQWQHLTPGTRVERNEVYLRTIQFEESQTVTVHVVSWQRGTRTVNVGNATREEPVATNVTERVQTVTLTRGWPMKKISLAQHNEPHQVTMWIEGVDGARWRFEHRSVATTQNAGIQSEGDYLWRVAIDFLVPFSIGGFLVGFLVDRAIDRAGYGPGYGLFPWFIGLSVATGVATLIWASSLADLLVKAPTILAVYSVGIIGIVMLETFSRGLSKVAFERLDVEAATSPSGENAYDYRETETRIERVLDRPDGRRAVIRTGIRPFLARVFGSVAVLENAEAVATRIKDTGPSGVDERLLVDPDAEEVLDYQPEGWTVGWRQRYTDPETGEATVTTDWSSLFVVTCLSLAGLLATGLILSVGAGAEATLGRAATHPGGLAAGLLIALVGSFEARDGHARIDPAPAHFRSAYASVAMLTEELEDARLLDEARDQLRRERIRSQQDVEAALDDLDRTLVEEAFDVDVGRRLDDGEGRDPTREPTEVTSDDD